MESLALCASQQQKRIILDFPKLSLFQAEGSGVSKCFFFTYHGVGYNDIRAFKFGCMRCMFGSTMWGW
jgi:hypothetical protein